MNKELRDILQTLLTVLIFTVAITLVATASIPPIRYYFVKWDEVWL